MEWMIKVGQLLLSLSILVLLHEGGHFLAARLFKTRVEKFYLFFDFLFPFPNLLKFSLFKIKRGDTEYGLGWFPLGGYVKIAGMLDESADKEQLKQPPQPWEYRSKKTWQRLIIILGGIIVNLLVGFFLYAMTMFIWGEKYLPTEQAKYGIWVTDSLGFEMGLQHGDKIKSIDNQEVKGFHQIIGRLVIDQAKSIQIERNGESIDLPVSDAFIRDAIKRVKKTGIIEPRIPFYVGVFGPDSPAQKAGIQTDDQILALNHEPTPFFDQFLEKISVYKDQEVIVSVLRNQDTLHIPVHTTNEGRIGVGPQAMRDLEKKGIFEFKVQKYGFFASIPAGFNKAVKVIVDYAKQLKLMFSPKTEAYKQVGGFKSIASIFPAEWNWEAFWNLTAFLSLVLAFMNFLPIPMLDGGYMIFILYEMIVGKPPGEKFMEYANTVGFILILALLLYANLNDFF
ncbi:MAG: RIP metalloprotease RseP [Candidatus Competibacteraceae bacterium]|nr:RIP metalloprotease RseP [Candidatus Competibacteraceae bacterium]